MKRSFLLFVASMMASACASEDDVPFAFYVQDRGGTLLAEQFDDYDDAIGVEYTIHLDEIEVPVTIGFCAMHACAGPVQFEIVTVTKDAAPNNILGYSCMGLRGAVSAALDLTGTGACTDL